MATRPGEIRPGEILRSLVFYAVFYGGTVGYVLACMLALPFSAVALRRVTEGWSRYHRACVRHILGITIRIEGEQPTQPVFYAVKHESFFEAIDLPILLNHPAIFAKEELFRIPLWGRVAFAYGMVPVARNEGARALRTMIASARAHLAEGRPLALFPEGTRIPHGKTPPLRSGFAGLYKVLALPVVPVAVDSGPLYHRRWKKRGTIAIRFGEMVPPGLPRAEAEERVHAAINALNETAS